MIFCPKCGKSYSESFPACPNCEIEGMLFEEKKWFTFYKKVPKIASIFIAVAIFVTMVVLAILMGLEDYTYAILFSIWGIVFPFLIGYLVYVILKIYLSYKILHIYYLEKIIEQQKEKK